jgi:hypothetical protein
LGDIAGTEQLPRTTSVVLMTVSTGGILPRIIICRQLRMAEMASQLKKAALKDFPANI